MLKNVWKYVQKKIAYLKRVKYSLMNNFKKKKPKSARKKEADKTDKLPLFIIVVVGLTALFLFLKYCSHTPPQPQEMGLDAAIGNYSHDIKILAHQFNLPPEYLMSVIMLECSGRKDVPPRFEQGVYNKLLEVKEQRQIGRAHV